MNLALRKSKFLHESKGLLRELVNILNRDFQYVSVLGSDCIGKKYSTNRRSSSIASNDFNERGFVARVYNDGEYYEYSFNEISKESLNNIVEKIKINIINLQKRNVSIKKHRHIDEIDSNQSLIKDIDINPRTLGDKVIIQKIEQLRDKGINKSNEIVNFQINYSFLQVNKIFLSNNKDLEETYMWADASAFCITSRNDKSKYYFDSVSGLKGVEILDDLEKKINSTVEISLSLLESEPVKPGEYDVIFSPDVSGLIAHEAFGHGVEMDMFVKDRAQAKDVIGTQIASPLVTMVDGAKGVEQTSSYDFDDEGTLAQDTIIIDKGILKNGLSDYISAMELNVKPTGNGKRESFERKAYSRMTNTYFKGGESTLEEMIKSIDYGLLIEGAGGGMEDPKNWGIQCTALVAREIKHGKLTGKIYSPIIITGYVPDVLKSISMVSGKVGLSGAGFCGKGHKEWVKVSCGGPYIKSKVRLG